MSKDSKSSNKGKTQAVKPNSGLLPDQHTLKASEYFEKYEKGRKDPKLLLKAEKEYKISSNPEGQELAGFCRAWYYRETGIKEHDPKKRGGLLLKSLTCFKDLLPKESPIIKKLKLEYLTSKISASENKPSTKLFLRRAAVFKELGQESDYNQDMALYHMFCLTRNAKGLSAEEIYNQIDIMLTHAKKGMNDELRYKVEGLSHQIKAGFTVEPLKRSKELDLALSAVNMTEDKYGKEFIQTEAFMAKALSTPNREERNKALKKAVEGYKKRGMSRQEHFAKSLLLPLPVKATHIIQKCKLAYSKTNDLEKKIQTIPKKKNKPSALFYHISYMKERVEDVERLVVRMAIARKNITDLQIEINSISPDLLEPGKPLPEGMQVIQRKVDVERKQMKQDLECLYIYGNLLLDQWSYTIGYIAGFKVPATKKERKSGVVDLKFSGLLDMLQAKNYTGELSDFWNLHKKDIIWLAFHLRAYRNEFVEHVRKPWQKGTTMGVYGDDFNFYIPSPSGYVEDSEKKKILEKVYALAPKRLKDMPDDYWEKRDLHRALEVTLYYIDELESQKDRDIVWKAWQTLGGSAPSYDVIALRLIDYIVSSLETLNTFVDSHTALVEFGYFE